MQEYHGSTSSGPVFPRRKQQWLECYICGFDFPMEEMVRHYRSQRWVDKRCDDQKTHSDYLAEIDVPRERTRENDQPVTCQGEAVDDNWYGGLWYDAKWYGKGDPCEINYDPTQSKTR